MRGSGGKWRLRAGVLGLLGAVLATGVVVSGGADAAQGTVTGATLEWTVNTEVQSAPPFGGCNYFSAGESDGTQATYAATAANVAVVKDGATPTWANHCTLTAGSANQKFVLSNGTGTLDTTTGASTIQWTGTASINFYGGLAPFWFANPKLTVAADSSGQLTATLGGYAASQQNPGQLTPITPVANVVVATLNNVNGANTAGFSVTPAYANVAYSASPGFPAQNQSEAGWGSWPTSWVDFQNQTGLSSYWYSSGASNDARKPPSAISVAYGTFNGPTVTAQPHTNLDASEQNVITVNGTGYEGAQAFNGVYVGLIATSKWVPGQTPNFGDFIGATFVPKQVMVSGAWQTTVTVPAGQVPDPAASYAIGTICAHACSLTDRSLDASTPVTFRHLPIAPTGVSAVGGNKKAMISFAGAPDGNQIDSYAVSCASANGGAAGSATGSASPITVPGLTNAKTYTCAVTATNGLGTGPAGTSPSFGTAVAPGAPTSVITKAGTSGLVVTFKPPAGNGGDAVIRYTATCGSKNGGAAASGIRTGSSAGPITPSGATLGKAYTCKVRAANGVGASGPSAASGVVVAGSPAAPTAPRAVKTAAGKIKVTFTIAANNGAPVKKTTATCASSNGGVTKAAAHSGANAAPITVSGLSKGKSYTCRVTATNARGTGVASAANAVKA